MAERSALKHEAQEKEPSFFDYLSIPRVTFFAIVVFYLLFGAATLHIFERQSDSRGAAKSSSKSAGADLRTVVEQLWDDSQNEDITEEEWKKRTKQTIEEISVGDKETDIISWTFAQSFLYTTASLTRIGSTIQPATFFGRLFVLFYTFFGIPLLLIFFADLGKMFVNLLQILVEHLQKKVKIELLPSISTTTGDIDIQAFILAVSVVLAAYVIIMSFFFRVWCGGSIFGNVYMAFLIVFGVGPAPLSGTETCANAGIFSIIPAFFLITSAPIAWSLTNMQTDLMGTEYIRKIHILLRKVKRD